MFNRAFGVGDYVVVTNPTVETSSDYLGQTFRVTEVTRNMLNMPLVRVIRIQDGRVVGRGTSFYPEELSHKYPEKM